LATTMPVSADVERQLLHKYVRDLTKERLSDAY
jgi:hypothetical protein